MKKALRYTTRILLSVMALLFIGLIVIKLLYGMGKTYPDIAYKPVGRYPYLEKFIKLDYPPGNIAVAPDGKVYFNYHPLARPGRFTEATVFEWDRGKITPFPSLEMQKSFRGTFGMTIDRQNRIWFIEPAALDFKQTRIWAFDLATKQKFHYYEFPAGEVRFSQDLRVTPDGKYILLANPGVFRFTDSKLLVYSIADHSVRCALEGGKMNPENWLLTTNQGKPYRLLYGLLNFGSGLDGIEISNDGKWVYLAPMSGSELYRAPLDAVLNAELKEQDVAEETEDLGQKTMSDGITTDKAGNVIITDVEHGGLIAFDVQHKTASLIARSKDILWADGVVTGPDSAIYFTDSHIPSYLGQLASAPDKDILTRHKPYYIYRIKN